MSSKEYHREWQKKNRHNCLDCGAIIGYAAERCKKCFGRGALAHRWKGGRTVNTNGYVMVSAPSHPNANRGGYVLEHRLIMEKHMGRTLLPTEVVHHINGEREDNRIENLMLFSSRGEHFSFHHKERRKPCQ